MDNNIFKILRISKQTQILLLLAVSLVFASIGTNIRDRETKKDVGLEKNRVAKTDQKLQPNLLALNDNMAQSISTSTLESSISKFDILEAEEKIIDRRDKDGVTAESYLVGNLLTGEVYLSKNILDTHPIASISKLFTVMTARDVFASSTEITITKEMLAPYGSTEGIIEGAVFTAHELEYPLVIESSNDVALVFATHQGYGKFIEQMNAYAKEIGLDKTSFNEPSGLSPKNKSSAKDLFDFSRFLYSNAKDILEISKTREFKIEKTEGHGELIYKNTNVFSDDPNFIGGKTGRTDEALETMLSLFEYQIDGQKYPVAIVVLRSSINMRQLDTAILIERFYDKIKNKN